MDRYAFLYESSDIPDGMTLVDWRKPRMTRSARSERRYVRSLLRRALLLVRTDL